MEPSSGYSNFKNFLKSFYPSVDGFSVYKQKPSGLFTQEQLPS